MKLKVYTDWWARWNPGNAGIWVFITDENGKEIEKRYKNLWIKTNNESEYLAAFYWIQRAIELKATQIEFYADSNLLINQLSGKWKIKKEELKKIYFEILWLLNESKVKINYFWISRENNKEADRLSNVAMNEVIKSKKNINFIT
jgi:ribonuclease HI/probable phosphoglycerate mutase